MGDRKWMERKRRIEEAAAQRTKQRQKAYHEAGHFIVAEQLGYDVRSALTPKGQAWLVGLDVTTSETTGGKTIFSIPRYSKAEDLIAIALAGEIAEQRGMSGRSRRVALGGSDLAGAYAAAWMHSMAQKGIQFKSDEEVFGRVMAAYLQKPERVPKWVMRNLRAVAPRAVGKVDEIVDRHWSAVENVAAALMRGDMVSSRQGQRKYRPAMCIIEELEAEDRKFTAAA